LKARPVRKGCLTNPALMVNCVKGTRRRERPREEAMKQSASTLLVKTIMTEFARETGLSPRSSAPRRYLWTDAFAVCNFLGLYQETGDEEFKNLALELVDQVHNTLGRHRGDDSRTGWISGLDEEQGREHPTRGGLRIGKPLQERRPTVPFDEDLEWDRDGQYYHYLTKWMHALNRVSRVTGEMKYHTWAVELAKTAHARFVYTSPRGGPKKMYWKMSIDLSRPLVPSMGQHDPLDGFVTDNELQATAARKNGGWVEKDLCAEILDMAHICQGKSWVTDDPLGLGGLLFDACRGAQLISSGDLEPTGLLETLLESSLIGLESFVKENSLRFPAGYRLAFRELGLSIGLRGVEKIRERIEQESTPLRNKDSLLSQLEILARYAGLREIIETFWLEGANRKARSYAAHRDINEVMLATSLSPNGFLEL
jgi:hypothetical protein